MDLAKPHPPLDVEYARSHFPALSHSSLRDWHFFENAGGSYACRQTIESLQRYYTETKVQPYGPYPASRSAGHQMDQSQQRWAEALGVAREEVHFGPSTSMNTYVLAKAFGELLGPRDEVIVTNQDHEANTGAIRRAAASAGAMIHEWEVDPATGQLDPEVLGALLNPRTKLVTFPHASNIVGQENDVRELTAMAHESGARVIVDGVSFAPHSLPDVDELNPDVYLFSLYKTYSVHQGLMVIRNGLIDDLPNQGHYFNALLPGKRLTPAGPDHGQMAAAGAVIDYIEALAAHHGGPTDSLREAARVVSGLWREHESKLLEPVLTLLAESPKVRVMGPIDGGASGSLHRCPTVAFVAEDRGPAEIVENLAARGIMAGSGHFYARRLIEALGVDPESGVVRLSFVHYTNTADIDALLSSLHEILD